MKWSLITSVFVAAAWGAGFDYRVQPFVFQSLESKTESGGPVFNRIGFRATPNQDIWTMQQSHIGWNDRFDEWDRLAIVVDKTTSPKVARFYQLRPGTLDDSNNFIPIPYLARCLACHSNGPRAIRPALTSSIAPVFFGDRLKILALNSRIKTYGIVESLAGIELQEGVPFRSRHLHMRTPLHLKSCVACHAPDRLRNPLTAEQMATAKFLVKSAQMPPFPFPLHAEDRYFFEND